MPPGDHDRLREAMTRDESELIELHRAIVRVPSVNRGDGSSAREDEVCEVMGGYLGSAGIESRTATGAPHRSNLLASRRATEPGPVLLFMSHSDVVPSGDESLWRFPPFSAELAEGRIWGRGANDCKMLVASQLFAAASLARLGLPRRGELRIAVGADEEAGGRMGFGWLAENESEFLRAGLAINEGGGAYLGKAASGRPMFLTCAGEKGRYEVTFTASGPGTHASVPWGKENPLVVLSRVAVMLAERAETPLCIAPVLEVMARQLGDTPPRTGPEAERLIAAAAARFGSAALRNSLLAQSRITIVPTILHAADKSNAVPASAELRCDARILPGQSRADLDAALAPVLAEFPGVQARIEETAASSVSPFTPEIAQLFERSLLRAFGEGYGGAPVALPTWCTGFTDSRFVRPLGTPAYGLQAVDPAADPDRLGIHCVDESIEAAMLLPCALTLAHLALDYCDDARA